MIPPCIGTLVSFHLIRSRLISTCYGYPGGSWSSSCSDVNFLVVVNKREGFGFVMMIIVIPLFLLVPDISFSK